MDEEHAEYNILLTVQRKGIIIFGLSDSTIVLTKSFFQSSTSLSNIVRTYTRSIDFQSKSE